MSKGDADGLRADTDDGFARIANLLLEALACSPLSGAQLRVIMFIMRRTYGWARANQRATGQMDTITAAEIEQGTGLPHRTVESAVARLAQMNVILSERVSPDNRRRYGVNPEINDWGLPTPEWALMKPTLQDARDTYTYKPVQLYGNVRIPLLENAYTSTQNCVQLCFSCASSSIILYKLFLLPCKSLIYEISSWIIT